MRLTFLISISIMLTLASLKKTINYKNNIILSIDDGMMGFSLLTKIKSMCSSGQTSVTVWLKGVWGSVIENKNETAIKWPFTVHKLLKK